MSERKPHPLVTHNQEDVSPYSCVNVQMESALDSEAVTSSKSMYFYPDRYTKLDILETERQADGHSRSMFDLPSVSSASPANHKEWMSEIKKDLEQFSQEQSKRGAKQPGAVDGSTDKKQIPSRWSQFMCEGDKSTSESEEEVGVSLESPGRDCTTCTHVLAKQV